MTLAGALEHTVSEGESGRQAPWGDGVMGWGCGGGEAPATDQRRGGSRAFLNWVASTRITFRAPENTGCPPPPFQLLLLLVCGEAQEFAFL